MVFFFCLLAECWHPEQAQGQEEKFSEYVYFSPHDVNLYVASLYYIYSF